MNLLHGNYSEFIATKAHIDIPTGLTIDGDLISPMLFDFQRDIVLWALRRGRASIFADCGLGKTPMQLEWARHIPGNVLILAPLAVSHQTIREGEKFGVDVSYARSQDDITGKITITNYEMLEHFDPAAFNGVVLDESSILKNYTGKYRNLIISSFANTQYKLCCTATPAPNDFIELGNHSEFMGVMTRAEMLSMFFIHDGGDTSKWRIKGHAYDKFWQWIVTWAVSIRCPSALGYDDGGFSLPALNIEQVEVNAKTACDGFLFAMEAKTLQDRQRARRDSVNERAEKAAEIVNATPGAWVIWCDRNAEADTITKLLPGAVNVQGGDSHEKKCKNLLGFTNGDFEILVTKPKIGGFGMNWQHCHNVVFLGLSDSWEAYYQAMRRTWRFGQKHAVNVYIITTEREGAVVRNIQRKERDAVKMAKDMEFHMKDMTSKELKGLSRDVSKYKTSASSGEGWNAKLGDCVECIGNVESDSIDYTVFSPPFSSLYTYSNSDRDMGNCKDDDEFYHHFLFLVRELFRTTKPGRLVSFHCMNLPTSKSHHGYIGIRDFRGDLIRMFIDEGWIYHSEVCIWKDPVVSMLRTKALGLLHKQLVKDSCMSRQGLPDYLVTMRKPGVNQNPVAGELDYFTGDPDTFKNTGRLSIDVWQRYASPIWMDIRQSNTLQKKNARHSNDERHICPLQLDVIERCLQLWSNPSDLVLSPFMGIASEGYQAIKLGRRFIGFELKESYFNEAVKNLVMAEQEAKTPSLFGEENQA